MSMYLGDITAGKTIRFGWNTNAVAGESITRATNGTVSVYKDGGTTQSTTGVTDTEDFDSLTGVHLCAIDTSADGTFYSAGSDFMVVLSGATIDSKSINAVLAHFSIANRSALRPTTADRTLDVSAGGEAGVDWANVGSPTTTLNLSGTTVKTATDVETDTADIQSRLPAALVSGRIDASVGAMAANTLTAAATAADYVTEVQAGLSVLDAAGVRAAVGLATANLDTQLAAIDDAVDTEMAAVLAAVDTEIAAIKAKTDQLTFTTANQVDAGVRSMATDVLDATALAAGAATEIATAVWASATRTLTGIASGIIASAELANIADAILDRNMATGTDSGSATVRTVRQALRFLRNYWDISGGTLTVRKEDDSTASWTAAVTQTAGNPVSAVDPASS